MSSRSETTDALEYVKLCFVTVGATASFDLLLLSVLDQSFLAALHTFGYTHLLVQYGKDGRAIFENFILNHPSGTEGQHGIRIDGFDFNQAGLTREMRLAKEDPSEHRTSGMVVSHAGSGSILEVLRLGIPLVVVPNPSLKDNHQEELACELQRQGYVVASHHKDVAGAVQKAESLRDRMSVWPPTLSANKRRQMTLGDVMADEMGFLD